MESIMMTDKSGTKRWYNTKGDLHREDGPAVENVYGTKIWYINGKKHREDGSAIEWYYGAKDWFLDGEKYTEAQYKQKMRLKKINELYK